MALRINPLTGEIETIAQDLGIQDNIFAGENPYAEPPPEQMGPKLASAGPKQMEQAAPDAGAGKEADLAGKGATTAGLYAANPYLLGAGLGLQALSMIQQGKQQERMNKYNAAVQRYNARQNALAQLTQVGQSLKV